MENQNAIEVRNMSKYFKIDREKPKTIKERILFWRKSNAQIHQVLKNVNLNIKKGETVALIGTNGSGKSTLLKLMTKIIFPNKGTVETNGKLTSLLELGAGFHIEFTGRENIYFNASIFGLTHKEIDKRIDQIIEFSELGEFIDSPIRTYSSGMYMRLAFSIAINVDADILLIDEILAVGDQHFQDKCYEKLRELRNSGKTIVIVSHDLKTIKDLCHRAIWIYQGEFKLDGDPKYVIDQYLKQIEIDNREKNKKERKLGNEENSAVLFIDYPKQACKLRGDYQFPKFRGWMVTNSPRAVLKISIDGEEVKEISHFRREDVYQVYYEQYAGFLNVDKIGWEISVENTQISAGKHTLSAKCVEPNKKVLYEMNVEFHVD